MSLSGSTALLGSRFADGLGSNHGTAFVFYLGGPVQPFRSGDGSGTPCPCASPGASGGGCANGSFPQGCLLTARGNAGALEDTLVLSATSSAPDQPGVFFQGDDALAGGAGVAFGDGLRCAGGNAVRLEVAQADAGGAASSSVSIAARAGSAGGEVKRYQWWYRDPLGSVCGLDFNLSNGLEVSWTP